MKIKDYKSIEEGTKVRVVNLDCETEWAVAPQSTIGSEGVVVRVHFNTSYQMQTYRVNLNNQGNWWFLEHQLKVIG